MMGQLHTFVVYESPADFPGKFVVRHWAGLTPHEAVVIADTLDEARAAIPAGMVRIPRSPVDDPVIVESWM